MQKRLSHNITSILKVIIIIVISIILFYRCLWYDTHYTRKAYVVRIDNTSITVIDSYENEWCFEGTGFCINDVVNMTMNTMGTDSFIYDDEIEFVKILTDSAYNE